MCICYDVKEDNAIQIDTDGYTIPIGIGFYVPA